MLSVKCIFKVAAVTLWSATLVACGGGGGFSNTSPSSSSGGWAWMGGANTPGASGVYGTQGVGSTSNVPGAREGSVYWTDSSGNFWLYGGADFSDLWSYAPATGQWTWVSGTSTLDHVAVYGTLGAGLTTNTPGFREGAVSWIDSTGNLWLFGGFTLGSSGTQVVLNDLWRFTPATQQWAWMGGANTPNALGVYGTLGTSSSTNVPGARGIAMTWTDTAGNFWLFGGYGFGADGSYNSLNDLWTYSTSTQQWTWMGGATTAGAAGVYGTLGTAAAVNSPGAREAAYFATDRDGNFWMFGGFGFDSVGAHDGLNDLWMYSPTTRQWTWVSGPDTVDAPGVYGTRGVASTANLPPTRNSGAAWSDSAGNFWLFGGLGAPTGVTAAFGDLWKFSPSTRQWTWVSGPNTINSQGVYGTLGTSSSTNAPPARYSTAAAWADSSNHLWMFGGLGFDTTGAATLRNDLWRY